MLELETYSGSSFFFEVDLGFEPDKEYAAGMAEWQDFISNIAQSTMGKLSLEAISSYAEKTVRDISPILLGEKPYQESDSWVVKCLKYVYYSTRALLFKTDEIEKTLETYQGTQEVIDLVKNHILNLEKTINANYKDSLVILFHLEAYQEYRDGTLGDGTELISRFADSYNTLLHARNYILIDGQKVELNADNRATLVAGYKIELETRFKMMDFSVFSETSEVELQSQLQQLFQQRTQITEKLHVLDDFLKGPLDRQLDLC